MIRHILLFKFNEGVPEATRQEAAERLRALGELCPTIGHWSVGVNIAKSPSAYDMAEVADYADADALQTYKDHPAHKEFSAFIGGIASWALVDFEYELPPSAEEASFCLGLTEPGIDMETFRADVAQQAAAHHSPELGEDI